jgi:MFS family permease
MATTIETELRTILRAENSHAVDLTKLDGNPGNRFDDVETTCRTQSLDADPEPTATNITTTVPEGGYGWAVVASCALLTFWFNGIMTCWGVIQAALLRSNLPNVSTSTISFVGSLGLAVVVAFGLVGVRVIRLLGARTTAMLGVVFISAAQITSSFTTSNVSGLFGTSGVLFGLGACLCYGISNIMPTQYFKAKLGLASGVVKFGGGVGAAVLSVAIDALISKVGIDWTFRIIGFCTLATGIPAAWFIRERMPIGSAPFLDLSMFRHLPFAAVFCSGAIGTFALFVPPYFLPLVAQSIGLSSATGAGLVAGFNACSAIGRLLSGWLSDRVGPVNTFLGAMVLNAVSMLAIWPVSNTLAPLLIFSMFNGLANGAFFTLFPVVVTSTAQDNGSWWCKW